MIGALLFGVSLTAIIGWVIVRIIAPNLTPHELTSMLTVSTFFGSINLLAISIIGSYVGRILDER